MRIFIFTITVLLGMAVHAQIDIPETQEGNKIDRESRSIGREVSSEQGSFRIDRDFSSSSSKSKKFLGQPDGLSLERTPKDNKINMQAEEEFIKRHVKFKRKYVELQAEYEVYTDICQQHVMGNI